MTSPSGLQLTMELAFQRRVMFAVEVLDAVTLSRLSRGITVEAEGLKRQPAVNASGLFVWPEEDFSRLRQIVVNAGGLPYQSVQRPASLVQKPLTTIELPPRIDYPFVKGITGLRGTLIEQMVFAPDPAEPVRDADIGLQWRDADGAWQDSPVTSRVDMQTGDFVSVLRLTPADILLLDESGGATVRLRVDRDGFSRRTSNEFTIPQGRITEPSSADPLKFSWDELQP